MWGRKWYRKPCMTWCWNSSPCCGARFPGCRKQSTKLVEDNRKKDAIIEEKNQIILNANRARFGQSSEQRRYILSDGQLSMFEIAGDGNSEVTDKTAENAKTVKVAEHERKAKRQ